MDEEKGRGQRRTGERGKGGVGRRRAMENIEEGGVGRRLEEG